MRSQYPKLYTQSIPLARTEPSTSDQRPEEEVGKVAASRPGISSGFPWLEWHEQTVEAKDDMQRTTDYEANAGTQSHW